MTFLSTQINNISDSFTKEQLLERLELVAHKIKFMDKFPILVLDSQNRINPIINSILDFAGAFEVQKTEEAVYIIYLESGKDLATLTKTIPAILDPNTAAFKNNRILLLADQNPQKAEEWVSLIEDIAEMTHPGYFVFGNEDQTWSRFQCL
ncbi:MAG: hypothetical protein K2Q03_05300 [Sphingobacteriaceae bacterium]|nr:hypothetical protein [Sphingobacteriaceae bacterium]